MSVERKRGYAQGALDLLREDIPISKDEELAIWTDYGLHFDFSLHLCDTGNAPRPSWRTSPTTVDSRRALGSSRPPRRSGTTSTALVSTNGKTPLTGGPSGSLMPCSRRHFVVVICRLRWTQRTSRRGPRRPRTSPVSWVRGNWSCFIEERIPAFTPGVNPITLMQLSFNSSTDIQVGTVHSVTYTEAVIPPTQMHSIGTPRPTTFETPSRTAVVSRPAR